MHFGYEVRKHVSLTSLALPYSKAFPMIYNLTLQAGDRNDTGGIPFTQLDYKLHLQKDKH